MKIGSNVNLSRREVLEVHHALPVAVEIRALNLNSRDIPLIGTLLACFQGPVVVDKEASTLLLP